MIIKSSSKKSTQIINILTWYDCVRLSTSQLFHCHIFLSDSLVDPQSFTKLILEFPSDTNLDYLRASDKHMWCVLIHKSNQNNRSQYTPPINFEPMHRN